MRTLKRLERKRLVVDANPILSAIMGGAALRVFECVRVLEFATAAHTLDEVLRYLPQLSRKAKRPVSTVFLQLALLPLQVYDRSFYSQKLKEATDRIGGRDPNDVDLLALAMALDQTVWSNDKDFESVRVTLFTTAQLLALLEAPR